LLRQGYNKDTEKYTKYVFGAFLLYRVASKTNDRKEVYLMNALIAIVGLAKKRYQ
jgi:hypothetical protein